MKNSTAFAAAGLISLFAWGAAFAQSPSQIPVGAGANVTRQPAGSRFRNPTNLPPAVIAPIPVAAPTAFSWTGFYVGGDIGGSFASTSIASATTGWASRSLNSAGVMGGAYAGYNYQVSPNFVLGLEGDFQGTQGNSNSASFYYPTFDVTPNVQQNWLASLNGRLGIAYDRALFYAIGGAAWGQGSVTVTPGILLFPPSLPPVSRTANLSGWDVGAGVEYAFDPRWVGRLEYRYYNFGSFNASNVGAYLPLHVQTSVNTVRAGLAYLFGAPAPVVVTKY
jgi:outer membrane immunogenic protein